MIRIIPAIDIIDGHVVRLTHGRFEEKTIYNKDPLNVAKWYQDNGYKYLHLVDLDGAKTGKIINWQVIEKIANNTSLTIDFGGGIRSENDVKLAFDSGAYQVTVGSIAVAHKEKVLAWIKVYNGGRFILGADIIDKKIAVAAWQSKTEIDLFKHLNDYSRSGITSCICTDVGRDGALAGPAHELYTEIKGKFPELFLIASGGVSNIDDVDKLNAAGVDGVIIGKAFYEGRIKPEELKAYLC